MRLLVNSVGSFLFVLAQSSPTQRALDRKAQLNREAVWHDSEVPLHHHRSPKAQTQFLYDKEEGVIMLKARQDLRLNAKGAKMENGDPLVLYPCSPHAHEQFKLRGHLIRLAANRDFCLNVQGGVVAGNRIITWPCAQSGKKEPHEDFEFDDVGRIRLTNKPELCMNVKHGVSLGAELILWPCADDEQPNELFEYKHDLIRAKHYPEFHFNVEGGNLSHPTPLIMWRCEAAEHELFEFTERGQVRLKTKPEMCLNAEGGLQPGAKIVLWPCTTTGPVPDNEYFLHHAEREVIYAAVDPNLVLTARLPDGAEFKSGDGIVLWPLKYKVEARGAADGLSDSALGAYGTSDNVRMVEASGLNGEL